MIKKIKKEDKIYALIRKIETVLLTTFTYDHFLRADFEYPADLKSPINYSWMRIRYLATL